MAKGAENTLLRRWQDQQAVIVNINDPSFWVHINRLPPRKKRPKLKRK